METSTASKWDSLKNFLTKVLAVIGLIVLICGAIKGAAEVKDLFWPPKPQIEAQNCRVTDDLKSLCFDLMINNPASKACSVLSIDLNVLNGLKVDLQRVFFKIPETMPEFITIPAGQAGLIKLCGDFKGKKLELPPDQTSVKGILTIKFNTNDTITQNISFILYRYSN
jgi:hypothetical protein